MINKKYLYAGAIGLVSISAATLYLQYKKMMDFVLSFNKVKINKITVTNIDFNLYLNYLNKGSVGFDIESQINEVYINNVFITKLTNNTPNKILPKSNNIIGLNISFSPKDAMNKLGLSLLSITNQSQKIRIKIVSKFRVKFFFIHVNIPYTYESTLKEMMAD